MWKEIIGARLPSVRKDILMSQEIVGMGEACVLESSYLAFFQSADTTIYPALAEANTAIYVIS